MNGQSLPECGQHSKKKQLEQERVMCVMIAVSIIMHTALLGGAGGLFPPAGRLLSDLRKADIAVSSDRPGALPEITVLGPLRKIPPRQAAVRVEPPSPADVSSTLPVPSADESRPEILTPDSAQIAMLRYQDMVKQRIEHCRSYPETARRQHAEGAVEIVFTINRGGVARQVDITRSSASRILDAEAIAILKRASPFLPIPRDIASDSVSMRVVILFSAD